MHNPSNSPTRLPGPLCAQPCVCAGPAMSSFWSFFGFGGIAASLSSARVRTSGRRDLLLPFAVHPASRLCLPWLLLREGACHLEGRIRFLFFLVHVREEDAHLLDELLYLVAVDCARVVGVVHVEKHLKLRLVDGHGLFHDDCLEFFKVHSAGVLGQRINRPRGCLAVQHLGDPEQGGAPVAPVG
eukprot:scaffold41905_cov54-Phaeocystis_antarctica.AAC.2